MRIIRWILIGSIFFLASNGAASDVDDALIRAAVKGDTESIRTLLQNGANVNARNELTGWTPLIAAAYYGFPEAVRLLLDSKADTNLRDLHDGTALMKAVTLGSFSDFADMLARKSRIVTMLLQAGADPYAHDQLGVVVWQMPFDDDLPELVKPFENADVKGVKEEELIGAVDRGNLEEANRLLQIGADVNLQTGQEESCWSRALTWGNPDMIDLLFQKGGDVNHTLDNGVTPLMVATTIGNAKLVTEFLKAGALPNAQNNQGQTALAIALRSGNQEIIQILKEAGAKP